MTGLTKRLGGRRLWLEIGAISAAVVIVVAMLLTSLRQMVEGYDESHEVNLFATESQLTQLMSTFQNCPPKSPGLAFAYLAHHLDDIDPPLAAEIVHAMGRGGFEDKDYWAFYLWMLGERSSLFKPILLRDVAHSIDMLPEGVVQISSPAGSETLRYVVSLSIVDPTYLELVDSARMGRLSTSDLRRALPAE